MKCQCDNEMTNVFSNHDDSYIDHWHCPTCGILLLQWDGRDEWYTPVKGPPFGP